MQHNPHATLHQHSQHDIMEEVLTSGAALSKNGGSAAGADFIEITVSEPQKSGDGMGSYIVYK